MTDALAQLIEAARKHKMTPEERKAQMVSYGRAEAGFGSDADEAEYRSALSSGDSSRIAACREAEEKRVAMYDKIRKEQSHD